MNRILNRLILIVIITFVSSNIPAKAEGTASPILLVNNTAAEGKYGSYIADILKAEGINAFDTAELSTLNATALVPYDLVILGRGGLSISQASMFTDYVNNGGRLIAFRPDTQLNPVVGLSTTGAGAITPKYMKIQNSASFQGQQPGAGLSSEALQLHTGATQYPLAGGAVMLAELYTDPTTPGSFPAVSGTIYGSGLAAAFAYDLPENIILTRQGNPENANLDVDADGVIRTVDLYQSTTIGGAPWVDLDRIPLPQADIQQRLFARLVRLMVEMPLPQLWYFPGTTKTMLILTTDDHGRGTQVIQNMVNQIGSFNGSTTFYLSMTEHPLDFSVNAWRSQGFGFGIHPLSSSSEIHNLAEGYQSFVNWWGFQHSSGPFSRTVRNHQVAWAGWTDAVAYESANNIAMDTNNYAWGPWLKNGSTWAHGYINGSGLPMKFVQLDGTVLPVFQQTTQLVDEQLFGVSVNGVNHNCAAYPQYECGDNAIAITRNMVDASQSGNYSALMAQFHTDYWGYDDINAWELDTMAYANSKSIPIWNADRWLAFTENRYAANFTNLVWNSGTGDLTFDLNPAAELTTMLPLMFNGSGLVSVETGGTRIPTTIVSVNGVDMAFFTVPAGAHSYTAHYSDSHADISLASGSIPTTVNAGDAYTYTWTVSNTGPDSALNVRLTDLLPVSLTRVSAVATEGTCAAGNPVVCDLGTLASGASATVTIVADVDPLARGSLSNTADVTTDAFETNLFNNSATKSVTAQAAVDVSLIKSDSSVSEQVTAGTGLTYTLVINQTGPSTATGLQVIDQLPAGVSYISGTGIDWTCGESSQVVTCNRSTNLVAAGSTTITITVNVLAETRGMIQNTATVTAVEDNVLTGNNLSVLDTLVVGRVDLAVVDGGTVSPVDAGSDFIYKITISNSGPSTALGATITDTLPEKVVFISASGGGWNNCAVLGRVVSCDAQDLPAGYTGTLMITVKAPNSGASLANQAIVNSGEVDINGANNEVTIPVKVSPVADVSVVSGSVPGTVNAGDQYTYLWILSNNGPDAAEVVQITALLPADLTLVSATSDLGTCGAGNPVVCNLGTLANGATARVTIVVDVDPLVQGPIVNSASVTTTTADPNPFNNTAVMSLSASEAVDLKVLLAANPKTARVNSPIRYTLDVSNLGPSTARNVTIEMQLPAGAVFVSAAGAPDWSCSQASGLVSCTRLQLAEGSAQPILIDILSPMTGSRFTAIADVLFSGTDLTPVDNSIILETYLFKDYYLPVIGNQ